MVSGILFVVAVYFVIEQTLFVMAAEKVQGAVSSLSAKNDNCGGKRRRLCTQFKATVQYRVSETTYAIQIGAGSARGHNQPVTRASYRTAQPVEVVYSPSNPAKAYQNTIFGVWHLPIIAFFGQIATLLGSMSEGRRRRR